MKTRSWAVLAIALLVVAAPMLASDGAAIYKAKCVMCHGADGAGQTPMGKNLHLRDLRSPDVQKQTDAELVKWISDGKGKMPAYKDKLTPADINAVVAYLRTLKK